MPLAPSRRIDWGDIGLSLVYLVLGLGVLAVGLWLAWLARGMSGWLSGVIWCSAPAALLGVVVLIVCRKNDNTLPKYFVFAGLLVLVAGVLPGAVAWFIRAEPVKPVAGAAQSITVVADVSDAVLFPDANGRRTGPDLFERNALAAAMQSVCQRVESVSGGRGTLAATDFWAWLRAHARLLVDWRPVPRPVFYEQEIDKRLYFMDGRDCRPVGEVKGDLAGAFERELNRQKDWGPRPTGLPPALKGLLKAEAAASDVRGRLVLMTTADVDGRTERAAWDHFSPSDSVAVTSVLLPSLPRSGQKALRGSGAKAGILRAISGGVVWLADEGEALAEEDARVPLFSNLSDLSGDDAGLWDRPCDLAEQRLKRFGASQVGHVRAAAAQDKLFVDFDKSIGATGKAAEPAAGPANDFALRAVVLAAMMVLLTGLFFAPGRIFRLQTSTTAPCRWARLGLLVLGLIGLAAVVFATYWVWPGRTWQQNGRPAAAVWVYVSTWVVLVLWPLHSAVHRPRDEADRLTGWKVAGAVLVLATLVLHPLTGLWLERADWRVNAAALFVPPALLAVLAFWRGSGGNAIRPDRPAYWTLPGRWGGVATVAAVWAGVVLIGFAPARGGAAAQQIGLSVMMVLAALLIVAVLCRDRLLR